MTQEEKDLLLKDLCARQQYRVKISVDDDDLFIPTLKYIDGIIFHFYECTWTKYFDDIKPYLRSMSSMTEEEKIEYNIIKCSICPEEVDDYAGFIDWLNARHFDYRGLIPMGLALEATEEMYNTKTE